MRHLIDESGSPQRGSTQPPPKAKMTLRRRLIRAVVKLLVAYILICGVMMYLEEWFIFRKCPYPEGDWKPAALTVEDAEFTAADSTRLHGWFVPHKTPRVTVLMAHGNAGNITHRVHTLQLLHRLGAQTLIFDYRGYGRSEGSANEDGVLADARAARAWLAKRTGLAENQIVLFGESIGGGVMVDLAARDGAGGLILQSTFTSLCDVAARAYPWLPVRMLMRCRMDSLSKIGQYTGPLLQCHGDADHLVPFELGQQLFAAAGTPVEHKTFITSPGGGHNKTIGDEFTSALDQFFARLAMSRQPFSRDAQRSATP
jgi:fermentation-respiration switch protein FrsA (DUF1100 family)